MSSQAQQLGEAAVIRWQISTAPDCAIVPPEANSGRPSRGFEAMAKPHTPGDLRAEAEAKQPCWTSLMATATFR